MRRVAVFLASAALIVSCCRQKRLPEALVGVAFVAAALAVVGFGALAAAASAALAVAVFAAFVVAVFAA